MRADHLRRLGNRMAIINVHAQRRRRHDERHEPVTGGTGKHGNKEYGLTDDRPQRPR